MPGGSGDRTGAGAAASERSSTPCDSTTEECPYRPSIVGRFGETEVKCGNYVELQADATNIEDGTETTFILKRLPGRETIDTVSDSLDSSQIRDFNWLSKKPTQNWPEWEVDFDVAASGVTEQSENQLKFHRYRNFTRAEISGSMQSPPAPAAMNFGWDKKVFIEFTDQKLVLTVKVRLRNKTQPRPERGRKESIGDYYARCDAVPVGDPVTSERKQYYKQAIEGIYQDEQILHRENCERSDTCDCDIRNKCCKFKVEVQVEFVEAIGLMINDVYLWPGQGRADSSNWYRTSSAKTLAHEVGHVMGFYDEYTGGATASTSDPNWVQNSTTSLMGYGEEVYDYYLEEFRAWFVGQAGEEFRLLEP